MNLDNKEVVHEIFGKGNVINYNDSYIKIKFKSGEKRFVFPDVFKKYITFIDQKATNLVTKKMEKKDEEQRKIDLILEKEKALERERQEILRQNENMKSRKIQPEIQSVFWCEDEEVDKIFADGQIFIGEIKSGKRQGQPRKLIRMNKNSACLLTKREQNVLEKDRLIWGVFMANEFFDGRTCEDGFITAHSEYKLQLSEEEAKKMHFWNYYIDKKSPDEIIWNSGRQRYFDNMWMAQILHDIVSLRDKSQEQEAAQKFLEYFCRINGINKDELPLANGALNRSKI